jgi:PAS domain S-box-containing protein
MQLVQGIQEMQAVAPTSRQSLSWAMKIIVIVVVVLGVVGLLAIVEWTDTTVLQHVETASRSLFPAALMIERAGIALQSMSAEYSDAVSSHQNASLESAGEDAAKALARIEPAANFVKSHSSRHQEIVTLGRRMRDLELKAKERYTPAIEDPAPSPEVQAGLEEVGTETKALQAALQTTQAELEGDYKAELRLIGRLPKMQGEFGVTLLLSVMTALFFSTRALIEAGARRREVEVLARAHKDTDLLLNSLPSLLIGLDADGCIRQWNKATTTILGWPEATVAGKTLDNCGVKWLTNDIGSRVAASVREPGGHRLDGVRLERNGTVRTLGLKAIELDTENVGGLLIIGADITERLELEEQLRQAHKLESIGQLAAGIAHEINTPTQYIGDNVGFLKSSFQDLTLLLKSYERLLAAAQAGAVTTETVDEISAAVGKSDAGYLLEEIPKAIEQTLDGIARVSSLVGAMKDFSHPGTKEKVAIDLNRAIDSTITVARNEWKYVADMETEYDPTLQQVYCLPGEFNQVILILIVNAAHAIADLIANGGPEKGKITVQTRKCTDWDEVRIQDTGGGIPASIRTRIFDPFFTTKEIGKGTGQGLAIARSVIVGKHGGTIHFETEVGKGTTFIIRLPLEGKTLTPQPVAS